MTTVTPMLARPFDRWKPSFPVYSQAKLDGIRCLLNSRAGWSREGNPFYSIPHIQDAMEDTFRQFPSIVFDGELYSHQFNENFNEIVSMVKKQKPSLDDLKLARDNLQFWLFDFCVPEWEWSFAQRMDFIRQLPIAWSYESPVKIVETLKIPDQESLDRHYEALLLDKFEGQMIRLDGPYEQCGPTERRSQYLFKRKPSQTQEFVIVALNEGEGKAKDSVGSFVLTFVGGHGPRFEAGVKMGYAERRDLWRNRDWQIGRLATVRFQNFTPDGKPRFGRVISIRNYE